MNLNGRYYKNAIIRKCNVPSANTNKAAMAKTMRNDMRTGMDCKKDINKIKQIANGRHGWNGGGWY